LAHNQILLWKGGDVNKVTESLNPWFEVGVVKVVLFGDFITRSSARLLWIYGSSGIFRLHIGRHAPSFSYAIRALDFP